MTEARPERPLSFLVISTFEKGQPFLRELAALGARVTFLTVNKLRDADWPKDILAEFLTMPEELTPQQTLNTVAYLARTRNVDRVVALDEFDMENAALIREHMRIPGMGLTTTRYFRDKLAMRKKAARLTIENMRVPEFCHVLNYDDLNHYMASVPAPWVLKPRGDASAIGIKKIKAAEELWPILDQLGDRQSYFLLERFVPGEIYHVDGITCEREVCYAAAHKYGQPPMQLMNEGGVFTTRTLDRESEESRQLMRIHAELIPALGLVHGVTHTEFIHSRDDGQFYFLETAARVGGAYIADVMEQAAGINPWVEWARIEVATASVTKYQPPAARQDYAGSVLCLAKQEWPDTSAYDVPEVAYRMKKRHHAGLIVRSADPVRVQTLLEDYAQGFLRDFGAKMPIPDRPTA
jgi:biotin carboxylase